MSGMREGRRSLAPPSFSLSLALPLFLLESLKNEVLINVVRMGLRSSLVEVSESMTLVTGCLVATTILSINWSVLGPWVGCSCSAADGWTSVVVPTSAPGSGGKAAAVSFPASLLLFHGLDHPVGEIHQPLLYVGRSFGLFIRCNLGLGIFFLDPVVAHTAQQLAFCNAVIGIFSFLAILFCVGEVPVSLLLQSHNSVIDHIYSDSQQFMHCLMYVSQLRVRRLAHDLEWELIRSSTDLGPGCSRHQ